MTLATGSRLGPYEILAAIGTGGMGEVYRARDPRLNREVAIKVLPASFSQDADRLRRFQQEAKAAGVLNHPNITAVYDIGTADGAPYVVQELLEGETLRAEIAGGPLAPRRAIDYAVQIAHGLSAAHDKGIVHRDLKPENLFVTRDGRVKVLDFGLAKLTQAEDGSGAQTNLPTATAGTEPGVVMGTLGYMSPEQIKGKPADARSDLFAFGAILYEMLSGRRAFHADSAGETMAAILKEDPPDLSAANPTVAPGLERIIRHCIEKSPERRFHSAHDLAFDLEAMTGTSGERTVPTKSASRPSWIVPLAAGALLASVAAGFFLGRSTGSRGSPAAMFLQRTFGAETVFAARFAPDGQTIVYSAAPEGGVPQLYSIGADYPQARPLGLPETHLLSVSSQGELAVLTHPRYIDERIFQGTLARLPLGGGAPREILDNVREADWSPDGSSLAVIRDADGRDQLEYPIGRVLWRTTGYLSDLRVSPGGDRVAFLEHPIRFDDRGLVALVDAAGTRTVLSSGYAGAQGLTWSPRGNEVLFAAGIGESRGPRRVIFAVTLSGKRRLALTSAGPLTIHDVSRDGRWLITRDEERLSIIAGKVGDPAERDLSWLQDDFSPRLSRDGRKVLFTDTSVSGGSNYTVCLRGVDGSPALRLGEGLAQDLSPDGTRVLAIVLTTPPQLRLYTTGAGQPRVLARGSLDSYDAAWFRDDRSVVISAREAGHAGRCYVQDIAGGAARPVTPEGSTTCLPSPDGSLLLAATGDDLLLFAVAGGPARSLPLKAGIDKVIRWTPDGRALWMWRKSELPLRIERFDIETGRRDIAGEIAPRDRVGLLQIVSVSLADDGKSYCYNPWRLLSQLFVVEGAR